MRTRKVALIIFYDKEKRILLQDRTGMSRWGNVWGFFGGGIEEGETPEQTVMREAKEELDVVLTDHIYLGNCKSVIDNELLVDRYVFIAPLVDIKRFTLHEGRAMQLFSMDEARKLKMVPGDELVLDMIEKQHQKA